MKVSSPPQRQRLMAVGDYTIRSKRSEKESIECDLVTKSFHPTSKFPYLKRSRG